MEIFVAEDFSIQYASCKCLEKTCYHVGALALHSGFKTPMFSCSSLESTDDTFKNDVVVNEVGDRKEIEFVDLEQQIKYSIIKLEDVSSDQNEVCRK